MHIASFWIACSLAFATPEEQEQFVEYFTEYLELCGGAPRIKELRNEELMV